MYFSRGYLAIWCRIAGNMRLRYGILACRLTKIMKQKYWMAGILISKILIIRLSAIPIRMLIAPFQLFCGKWIVSQVEKCRVGLYAASEIIQPNGDATPETVCFCKKYFNLEEELGRG